MSGPPTSRSIRRGRDVVAEARPAVTFLCSPNNPTGLVDPPAVLHAVLEAAPGLVVVDEAYAQFADWTTLDLVDDDVPLVVVRTFSKTWSMAAAPSRLPRRTTMGRWRALENVVLPYHLDAAKQLAGPLALDHVAEMDPGETGRRRAGAHGGGSRAAPVAVVPERRQLRPVPTVRRAGGVAGARGSRRLVRDCSSWPRLANCLRVTVGTPEENDRFLDALGEAVAELEEADRDHDPIGDPQARHQGDVGRGRARARRLGDHRVHDGHPVLRPHARPTRPPRRVRPHGAGHRRPAHRHPPHGRGRGDHSSARRFARPSATRPGSGASPAASIPWTRR